MSERLDYTQTSPGGAKAFGNVYSYVMQSGLDEVLVDLVYLRVGTRVPPYGESVGGLFEALAAMRAEGLIRHLGVSNVDATHLAEARTIAMVFKVLNNAFTPPLQQGRRLGCCGCGVGGIGRFSHAISSPAAIVRAAHRGKSPGVPDDRFCHVCGRFQPLGRASGLANNAGMFPPNLLAPGPRP